MDDKEIVERISELAAEEQRLEEAHVGEGLSDDELARKRELEVTLGPAVGHRCASAAPSAARARTPTRPSQRSADTVEGYLQ